MKSLSAQFIPVPFPSPLLHPCPSPTIIILPSFSFLIYPFSQPLHTFLYLVFLRTSLFQAFHSDLIAWDRERLRAPGVGSRERDHQSACLPGKITWPGSKHFIQRTEMSIETCSEFIPSRFYQLFKDPLSLGCDSDGLILCGSITHS